ncbi:hypothetical protein ANN_05271 [Periplaneta americana]|uniref:Uncharacterized protein n=1 Tax=Periplaneta americana TaxID=6978 RepID=A0ABQ8TCS7_PERAM|nr:hypothetical protein ANN_05271 [Periplaneta americana]
MAGLCEGGNEPSGSLKAISFSDRRLATHGEGWPRDEGVACSKPGYAENLSVVNRYYIKVNDICVSEKSILSRLRTSHNLRDIAQGQFRSPKLELLLGWLGRDALCARPPASSLRQKRRQRRAALRLLFFTAVLNSASARVQRANSPNSLQETKERRTYIM